MANRSVNVEIDRIRLSGLELMPEQATHLRALIESELGRMLSRERFGEAITAGEIATMKAPEMNLSSEPGERGLAEGVAQSIAQGLLGSN